MRFEPRAPIFVWDDDTLDVYPSLPDALAIEPWDVTDALEVYDADARRIKIRAEGVKRTRFTVGGGRVFVDWDASGDLVPAELATILGDFVESVGPDAFGLEKQWRDGVPLPDLVAAVAGIYDTDRSRRRRLRRGSSRARGR